MNGKKTALPFRVLAALCAFLLTACVAGIAGSLLLRQAATDTGLRGEAAVSPAVLKSQRAEIYRRMEELGEKYGISAEKLSGGIGEESLKAFDLEAAA